MRKAILIATALVAVLALSVGAFAYPVLVGSRSLGPLHIGAPATTSHPKGGDNPTGNETNDNETENETRDNETEPAPPAPEANETENESETGNVSVVHTVTVTQADNVTFINGTITVIRGNQTLADFSFRIVDDHNGTVSVTFNGTTVVNGVDIAVRGLAVFEPESRSVSVFGTVTATQNGSVLWARMFAFATPGSESGGS